MPNCERLRNTSKRLERRTRRKEGSDLKWRPSGCKRSKMRLGDFAKKKIMREFSRSRRLKKKIINRGRLNRKD